MDRQDMELSWLKSRQSGIGSSDAPILILGEVFKKTSLDVYLDKVKNIDRVPADDNPNFRRGHTYEPLAAEIYRQQAGVEVFTPRTDGDRFGGFQRRIPGRPLFADFDGICEDGWVFEAKCPTQGRFDQIVSEGVDEYYQVQAHHLAGVAHYAHDLPWIDKKKSFKILGTKLVFYAPEEIRLHVVEIPFEIEVVDNILNHCEQWWNKHIVGAQPPIAPFVQKVKMEEKKKAGLYTLVDGPWEEAVDELLRLKRLSEEAQARETDQVTLLKATMEEAKLERISVPAEHKVVYALQDGKETLDIKALQATHPALDLKPFYKTGNPFRSFRVYEKGKKNKETE